MEQITKAGVSTEPRPVAVRPKSLREFILPRSDWPVRPMSRRNDVGRLHRWGN